MARDDRRDRLATIQRYFHRQKYAILIGCLLLCRCEIQVEAVCTVNCADYCADSPPCSVTSICVAPSIDEELEIGTAILNISVTPPTSEIRLVGNDAVYLDVDDHMVIVVSRVDSEAALNELEVDVQCREFPTDPFSSAEQLNLRIEVDDINDNLPTFNTMSISASISEDAEVGTLLMTDVPIKATDNDEQDRGLKYTILETNVPFQIREQSQCPTDEITLEVAGNIDYEDISSYTLTIMAEDWCTVPDWTGESNNATATVYIQVEDVDDLPPKFEASTYSVTVPERTSGFSLDELDIYAYDQDTGINAAIQYSFIGQSGSWGCSNYFEINETTAEVSVVRELDYETSLTSCDIIIQAVEADNCAMVATATLTVTVSDLNECPNFMEDTYEGYMSTDDLFVARVGSTERLLVGVTDDDMIFSGNITGSSHPPTGFTLEFVEFGDSSSKQYFIAIENPTLLSTNTYLQLGVYDDHTDVPCNPGTSNVTILLLSEGLAPDFTRTKYFGNVSEGAHVGTSVLSVSAFNSDGTATGIAFKLPFVSDGGEKYFAIGSQSGKLLVKDHGIDAEEVSQYTIIVEAVDKRGTYHRSNFASVVIDVIDVNEFPPVFGDRTYELSIEEEVCIGSPVLTVQATDKDVHSSLEYYIPSINSRFTFMVDQTTGQITTSGRLDSDDPLTGKEVANLTVLVTDGTFEDTAFVQITLLDINDNAPQFVGEPYHLALPENEKESVTFNVSAIDTDRGANAEIVFSMVSPTDDDRFTITVDTGIVSVTGPFDYEEETEYLLVVMATDQGANIHLSATSTVTVSIIDVNDNAPTFTDICSELEVAEDIDVGSVICTVVATDADEGGTQSVTYSTVESTGAAMFDIDMNSGELKILTSLDREIKDTYTITVTAADNGMPQHFNSTSIVVTVTDVNDNRPVFDQTQSDQQFEWDDITDIPFLMFSVKATDKDLSPWNTIQCLKSSGCDALVVLTSQDGTCDVLTYKQLEPSPDPYNVTIVAFNSDDPSMTSDPYTLYVYIWSRSCYVTFTQSSYYVSVGKSELDSGVAVITVKVTSNCNLDDVMYVTVSQTYQSDVDSDAVPSSSFTVDYATGAIFPTSVVEEGMHSLIVSAYNQSDVNVNEPISISEGWPELLTTTKVYISVVNQGPPSLAAPHIIRNCDEIVKITEELSPPAAVCDVDATSSYDNAINFGLYPPSEDFNIDSTTGDISAAREFDYDNEDRDFVLLVYAEGVTSGLRNYTYINVVIVDINDNEPKFSQSFYTFFMNEHRLGSDDCVTHVGALQTTDADSSENSAVMYSADDTDFAVLGDDSGRADITTVTCIHLNSVKYAGGEARFTVFALNVGETRDLIQTSRADVVVYIERFDLGINEQTIVNQDHAVFFNKHVTGNQRVPRSTRNAHKKWPKSAPNEFTP